jgi:hypothetical protein
LTNLFKTESSRAREGVDNGQFLCDVTVRCDDGGGRINGGGGRRVMVVLVNARVNGGGWVLLLVARDCASAVSP